MTTHPLILIIAAILAIGGAAVFVAGIMKSAGWADAEMGKTFTGDGVSNAGDANSEMQAGTGETSVAGLPALKPESSTVVNAPLPQSSPSACNYFTHPKDRKLARRIADSIRTKQQGKG